MGSNNYTNFIKQISLLTYYLNGWCHKVCNYIYKFEIQYNTFVLSKEHYPALILQILSFYVCQSKPLPGSRC